uniref:Putative secretory peptide-20 n=1 Tax=Pleurobrachia bachei TaxID=34499 RepID=M4H1V8_PLEBA|nr:putative secretory peptide-20 [Pleurobrachia bachei]|eukprot:sb/3465566/
MRCFLILISLLALSSATAAWNPVVRDTFIPFDLESTPLQIKTDSTAGSEEQIWVRTYTADGSLVGGVGLKFTSSIQYAIGFCNNNLWVSLPVQPPEEVDKVWTIRKNTTAVSIECNGVEVLNYQLSESSDTRCVSTWGGDVVEKIMFHSSLDTASDSYRTAAVWCPVVRDTLIPFDLESTPLQIKTDLTAGSEEQITVDTYNIGSSFIGGVGVKFTSPIQYGISFCTTSWTVLPVQPGDEVDKIWTIRKTTTAVRIECNGLEVLNYQFSDSSASSCVSRWGGDVVEKILFYAYDTASDSYRVKPVKSVCPEFTVDGSVQESWNDTDIGQTVTINCQRKHVLDGSSERTCNAEGVWDSDAPLCRKLSEFRWEIEKLGVMGLRVFPYYS